MTIRHKCEERGCWLKTMPDWGFLDDCFPGRIRMGDMDGVVERHGFLFLAEWKGPGVPLPKGQQIMFSNLCRRGNTIAVCWGDVTAMAPEKVRLFHDSKDSEIGSPTQDKLREIARRWIAHVDSIHGWQREYGKECERLYGDKS